MQRDPSACSNVVQFGMQSARKCDFHAESDEGHDQYPGSVQSTRRVHFRNWPKEAPRRWGLQNRRPNRKPIKVGNNSHGRRGKLRCLACRSRNSKVLCEVFTKAYHYSVSLHRMIFPANFANLAIFPLASKQWDLKWKNELAILVSKRSQA